MEWLGYGSQINLYISYTMSYGLIVVQEEESTKYFHVCGDI